MVHDLSSKLWYAKTIYYTAFHNPRRLGWTGQNIISNINKFKLKIDRHKTFIKRLRYNSLFIYVDNNS